MLVHWIQDLVTGQKDGVEPVDQDWGRVFKGVGDGSHTFVVQDSVYPREIWWDLLKTDWSRLLIVAWEDPTDSARNRPLYAGVITGADPNDDGTVTVQHTELAAFLDARLSFVNVTDPALVLAGRSLRGQLLQLFVTAITGPRRSLPLHFTSFDEAGSAPDLVANPYEVLTIQDLVDRVVNSNGGPDWDWRPEWSFESELQFDVRVGTPTLAGPLLEFNVTAAKPGQMSFTARTDGAKRASKVWSVGKGSEADMRIGRADVAGTSPALERVRPFKDEADVDVLNGLALAEAQAFRFDTVQPTLTVPIEAAMEQGFELGSPVRLLFEGHWWWPDEPQNYQLIGYGMGSSVRELKLQIRRV